MKNSYIEFTKKFYNIDAINMAVIAYKGIAKIVIKEDAEKYICKIRRSIYDLELVAAEFGNYVLAMMNK